MKFWFSGGYLFLKIINDVFYAVKILSVIFNYSDSIMSSISSKQDG